jgi:hypothetical protein
MVASLRLLGLQPLSKDGGLFTSRGVGLGAHHASRRIWNFLRLVGLSAGHIGRIFMSTILIIVLLVLLLGGGGFGYSRWGAGGAGGALGLVLVVILILWLLGAVGHA